MNDPMYDLFKGTSREDALWIETVKGLQPAIERMKSLALTASSDYFVFHNGDIVASTRLEGMRT